MMTYLIKLNIGLLLVWLAYQFIFRRFTFYRCNRLYLILMPLLCFAIPLLDITALWQQNAVEASPVMEWIPAVEQYSYSPVPVQQAVVKESVQSSGIHIHWLTILTWLMGTGTMVILLRLLMQLLSIRKIRAAASSIEQTAGYSIYYLPLLHSPFSFGSSIFINPDLYESEELSYIITHEKAHARQQHSKDVVLFEILFALVWYNPVMWLLKKAVKTNLEFLADEEVLQTGVDAKQYQYLLLKVHGQSAIDITNNFNFHNLKKRILMMNKKNSSKIKLAAFGIILPLLTVLLVSFRKIVPLPSETKFFYTGYVFDGSTELPLAGVKFTDEVTGKSVLSDNAGFYAIALADTGEINISAQKDGWLSLPILSRTFHHSDSISSARVVFVGLKKNGPENGAFISSYPSVELSSNMPTKELIQPTLDRYLDEKQQLKTLKEVTEKTQVIFYSTTDASYILNGSGSMKLTPATDIIYVNDKRMTGEEVNKLYSREDVMALSMIKEEDAINKYHEKTAVFKLIIRQMP